MTMMIYALKVLRFVLTKVIYVHCEDILVLTHEIAEKHFNGPALCWGSLKSN